MAKFLAKPQRFIIRPAPGWIKLTITEVLHSLEFPLQSYKFKPIAMVEDGQIVVSECDFRQGMELTARVTTAHDIDWVLASGRVSGRGEWVDWIEKSGLLEVFATPQNIDLMATVTHPVVGTEKDVKIIFREYFEKSGHRCLTETKDAESLLQRLRVDCQKNRTRLLLSMGGEPLYKRGYKAPMGGATAPLPEHHAAACFRWALDVLGGDLRRDLESGARTLVIPFAGTGTTGFEAVCQLAHLAPGIIRKSFGFERWSFFPEATMATIRKRLNANIKESSIQVRFGDINTEAIAALHQHCDSFVAATGLAIMPSVFGNDFLAKPEELCAGLTKIFLPLNPPYGHRLAKDAGAAQIYERLGTSLVRLSRDVDISGYIICPDETSWLKVSNALRRFKTETCHFSHGGNDTRLLAFATSSGE